MFHGGMGVPGDGSSRGGWVFQGMGVPDPDPVAQL